MVHVVDWNAAERRYNTIECSGSDCARCASGQARMKVSTHPQTGQPCLTIVTKEV